MIFYQRQLVPAAHWINKMFTLREMNQVIYVFGLLSGVHILYFLHSIRLLPDVLYPVSLESRKHERLPFSGLRDTNSPEKPSSLTQRLTEHVSQSWNKFKVFDDGCLGRDETNVHFLLVYASGWNLCAWNITADVMSDRIKLFSDTFFDYVI